MLTRLGVRNKALGFIAGFTGDILQKMLLDEGVDCSFLKLKNGDTRINVKIKADTELDINARGPKIEKTDIENLIRGMSDIKRGDYLVLAGSVPDNLPSDTYEQIMSELSGKGISFVVDTTKELLFRTLKYKPFLIKPNHYELGELFGVKIQDDEDVVKYALRLQEMGARNVLVSLGSKGDVLIDENSDITNAGTVKGKVINTVGSGDSMLAGFLAGYIKTHDFKYALRLATACGNATAFSKNLASAAEALDMFDRLNKTGL